jgi:hypothetical protein
MEKTFVVSMKSCGASGKSWKKIYYKIFEEGVNSLERECIVIDEKVI